MEEEVIPRKKGGKYTKRTTTITSKECSALSQDTRDLSAVHERAITYINGITLNFIDFVCGFVLV